MGRTRSRAGLLRLLLVLALGASALIPTLPSRAIHAAGVLPWNTTITPGPIALARPAVALGQDGNIYVFGGTTGNDTDYSTTFIYQPATNAWSLGANMPVAREGAQAVTLPDGRIAVLGGGTQCAFDNLCSIGTVYNRVDVYTPATNSWSSLAPMQSPRYRFAASLYNGHIYAMGGSDGTQAVSSVEAYDPNTDIWASMPSLPQPTEAAASAVDSAGNLDLFGGFDGGSNFYNNLVMYNGSAWNSGAALPQATEDTAAPVGSDGQVYIVGGFDTSWLDTVQSYNPISASWSSVTPLPSPTCCMGAVTIPSGQMYVVAGGIGLGSTVAVYGPSLSLSPPSGPPGSVATLNGTNFAPLANVSVYWGGAATGELLGSGTTDASGALVSPITFTVPATATSGTYSVAAQDDQSLYPVNTPFTVPGQGPSIPALRPNSGAYGRVISVSGANFRPGEYVNVYWDSALSGPRATVQAQRNGTFTANLFVPQAGAGPHTIIAYGLSSHLHSVSGFLVRPETFPLHASAAPGSQDILNGYGFAPHQKVQAYWRAAGSSDLLLGSATTNAWGSFAGASAITFTVPTAAPGIYDVLSMGTSAGGLSTLTVTP